MSSLVILDEVMRKIAQNEQVKEDLLPCEYFDLICGSDFGGVFALLLGQLRMVSNLRLPTDSPPISQ